MKIHHLILATFLAACATKSTEKTPVRSTRFKQVETRIDTSFTKFKVDDITPCFTTLTDLRKLNADLKEIGKSELDSFFIAYSYYSDNFYINQDEGLLIGTYEHTELVNTFWLTDKFKGTLTDRFIDVEAYTVSQMTKDFPEPRFQWTTTGVSPYWIYSNDTISFFIALDTTIQRFPLDEAHYANHKMKGIQMAFSCWKIYGPTYGSGDTVLVKPLYSPLAETHTNYFLLQRQPGLGTTLREIFSGGKKTTLSEKRIGLWIEYTPDHIVRAREWYDDGKFIMVDSMSVR